ncbi:MAG TPA: PQQ-binding-like beta-propeller repeat protein, partial [Myxococcaceae bacterium]|nr:PQQ-binding-like beta-propeller repeat protein [Myxococcaceae bacterium]
DLSNNLGKADAGVNVTRWKWRYSAGAPIYTTPAIADDGTIVFGTSDGGSGSLYALSPNGSESWRPVELGPVQSSPAVGPGTPASALVYVATAAPTGSKMHAVRLSDGSDAGVCASGTGAPFLAGLALVETIADNGPLESAVGISGTNRLYTLRPRAQTPTDSACIEAFVTIQQSVTETIAGDASGLFVGAVDNTTRSFTFDETSRNWVKNPSWPGGTTVVGGGEVGPLAVLGSDLLATARPDGLYKIAKGTGVVTKLGPDGGVSSDPSGPVATPSRIFFTDTDPGSASLWTFDSAALSSSQTTISGPARSVPLAGAGGLLYVASNAGSLEARSSDRRVWAVSLAPEGISASVTLDCSRAPRSAAGNPSGILYSATTAGSLFAIVVDSPGLDSTAPWPKYQHDVRNTGNPSTPIQSCP